AAARLGAPVVELHTGPYAHAVEPADVAAELDRLTRAAEMGAALGLEIHAGHGLTYDNVAAVAALPQLAELNIGHFLVGEAVFVGLGAAIRRMRDLMDAARPWAPA
ncbi:pyridoxine 5'-phosphate synthase, partial [Sandarakinorhabdus rubra]|uniref:pyridoxine 5'-phosphate synthase n=1 Tax=Sandarakinorhabdus rubra TaxID=2672568 RepID=UPI001969EFBE